MSKRYPRYTIDRHEEVGGWLVQVCLGLDMLAAELSRYYPHSGPAGKVQAAAADAQEAVDGLRQELARRLVEEHPLAFDYRGGNDGDLAARVLAAYKKRGKRET